MTQTPDEPNTADFQRENQEQIVDQDSEPTTMAPDDARPDLARSDDSEAQESDDAGEASPS